MPPMRNHNVLKEMAEKATGPKEQTTFVMMEFRDFKCPSPPKTHLAGYFKIKN